MFRLRTKEKKKNMLWDIQTLPVPPKLTGSFKKIDLKIYTFLIGLGMQWSIFAIAYSSPPTQETS